MPSPMLVQLPIDVRTNARHPAAPLDEDFELRDNNRISAFAEAELQVRSTPKGLRCLSTQDPTRSCAMAIIKDLSRTGIGLYYHQQLFPQELIEVTFHSRRITAVVVRCRYLSNACFEVGGKVVSVKSYRS